MGIDRTIGEKRPVQNERQAFSVKSKKSTSLQYCQEQMHKKVMVVPTDKRYDAIMLTY